MRWGKWKAVRNKPQLDLELYDLDGDPREQHDVADKHLEIVKRIGLFLKNARTPCREYPTEKPLWSYPPLETGFVR